MSKLTQEERDELYAKWCEYIENEEFSQKESGDWWLDQIDKILEEREYINTIVQKNNQEYAQRNNGDWCPQCGGWRTYGQAHEHKPIKITC